MIFIVSTFHILRIGCFLLATYQMVMVATYWEIFLSSSNILGVLLVFLVFLVFPDLFASFGCEGGRGEGSVALESDSFEIRETGGATSVEFLHGVADGNELKDGAKGSHPEVTIQRGTDYVLVLDVDPVSNGILEIFEELGFIDPDDGVLGNIHGSETRSLHGRDLRRDRGDS